MTTSCMYALASSAGKSVGIGTFPYRGLPQLHRASPSAALDELNILVVVLYISTTNRDCQIQERNYFL